MSQRTVNVTGRRSGPKMPTVAGVTMALAYEAASLPMSPACHPRRRLRRGAVPASASDAIWFVSGPTAATIRSSAGISPG